ncbi:MAG: asparagine synthase (glutamine-hydrolyzing) [Thaumarchaeota archaeon]|nr:asparagine synthase (glutamine-hydrolyzing) [Nitrososphaerota archaeon]
MCGINGFTWADAPLVEEMNRLIEHRGPDDHGTHVEDGVSLGSRRLAIIDLSPSGHMPMRYERGGKEAWITYNGEIYNYDELRTDLAELGYRFTSQSDTEVILAAYLEWGTGCVDRFNGMWAFAIFDVAERTLFLSRDRFGIKPLYLHYDGSDLIFSSEIKALFAHDIARKPNDQAVFDYLYHGLHDHGAETFFDGISRLMRGQNATFSLQSRKLSLWTYYDLEKKVRSDGKMTPDEFGRLFLGAVKAHMVADVPVGSCLSGGLDSTSVVCAMRENDPKADIKVFSLAFPGEEIDESDYQEMASSKYAAERYSTTVTPADLAKHIRDLLYVQEEPFGDLSVYGQYQVMHLAHDNGMKVLLDGQGSDEILAGYYYLAAYYYYDLLRKGSIVKLAREIMRRNGPNPQTTRYFLGLLLPTRAKEYLVSRDRRFLDEEFVRRHMSSDRRFRRKSLPEALVEALTYFPLPSLLRYEDKNSMAWSIESRVPFLDYRLVESALGQPNKSKIDHGLSKVILRESLHGKLPAAIENRRDKLGFATPEKRLLSSSAIQEMVSEIVTSEAFKRRPYWDWTKVELLAPRVAEKSRFQFLKSESLWRVVLVELWLETWIDRGGAS